MLQYSKTNVEAHTVLEVSVLFSWVFINCLYKTCQHNKKYNVLNKKKIIQMLTS